MNIESIRMVALKLHNLHEEDQSWILSKIDTSIRPKLESLLSELGDLDFEIDEAMFNSIKKNNIQSSTTQHVEDEFLDIQSIVTINKATKTNIDIIFEHEPKAMLHTLKSIKPWKWSDVENNNVENKTARSANFKKIRTESLPTLAVRNSLLKAVEKQLLVIKSLGVQVERPVGHLLLQNHKQTLVKEIFSKIFPWKK